MRVLVTGGAGFIGSAATAELLEAGHDVTVVDNLSSGDPANVPLGAAFEHLDIADAPRLSALLRRGHFDACMHFAACIDAGESMRNPAKYFRANTAATAILTEELLRANVPRLVFSSTAAVYGEPETDCITEDAPQRPTNAYGASKLAAETALQWTHRQSGLRVAVLRYFNAAGAVGARPEAHEPETHLIPLALDAASGRQPALTIFGDDYDTRDGSCVRDFVHVRDIARAHRLALDRLDDRRFFTCNLGSSRGATVLQVLDTVERVTGQPVPFSLGPRRPGDPSHLVASNDRAKDLLGWEPTSSDLATIVRDAWQSRVGTR